MAMDMLGLEIVINDGLIAVREWLLKFYSD